MTSAGPDHLFVYGTLRPGETRWHHLAPFVSGAGFPDAVPGALFDTGRGYPAADFSDPGLIVGHTFRLHAVERALEVLDDVEGAVAGLYRRVVVRTRAGVPAWAYEGGVGLALVPIPGGDWQQR
jgi:gamma-glutamylcyclotransferase (GGCT)/AIG2-like uncharacterized protein YtfP